MKSQLLLEAHSAQDKTHKKFRKHLGTYYDKVSSLKIQCDLQEGRNPIYIYECLREEERKGSGVNDYKLLETR